LAKTTPFYVSTLYASSSSLTELGSVIGKIIKLSLVFYRKKKKKKLFKAGISPTDIAQIPLNSINSISSSAWTYMPPSTVNSLSSSQIAGFSSDQLTALVNSPNAANFSSLITSALESAIAGNLSNTSINIIDITSSGQVYKRELKWFHSILIFILCIFN